MNTIAVKNVIQNCHIATTVEINRYYYDIENITNFNTKLNQKWLKCFSKTFEKQLSKSQQRLVIQISMANREFEHATM